LVNKLAEIQIKDKGIGIKSADLSKIFRPYFRGHQGRVKTRGLGLGLYITSEIIKRHQGSISVISQFKKGTTFKILLPIYHHS